jgi:hypothetical protein
MIPLVTGFAAGGLHVFAGPDHLAALAPIAMESTAKAGRIGAYWGFGHGVGVVIVGGVALVLRSLVDIGAWSQWAELVVGFLLLGVGAWAVWKASRVEIHVHEHDHDAEVHEHVHAHDHGGHGHHHAAMGIGLLHGMAGSGHLFGVLPALALGTGQAVVYLAAYLVAAVLAMGGFAYVLGRMARLGGPMLVKRLMYGSGTVALVVGVFWIVGSWPV